MSSFGPAMKPSRLIIVCQSTLPIITLSSAVGCFLVDRDHHRKSSAVGRAERPISREADLDGLARRMLFGTEISWHHPEHLRRSGLRRLNPVPRLLYESIGFREAWRHLSF